MLFHSYNLDHVLLRILYFFPYAGSTLVIEMLNLNSGALKLNHAAVDAVAACQNKIK